MPTILSTYRVQLRPPDPGTAHPGFGFDDAAGIAGYLAELGVTHLYCSPCLTAAPGSAHGYDVVDHTALNPELGGRPAFDRMVAACREAGLGIVLDVVPNHMAISEPESQNAAWWSVLREGPASPYADWFDIDWDSPDNPGKVLVPVLGAPLGQVLDDLEQDADRIRYFGHEVPVAPGTLVEGDVLATLERQHYRLCLWRVAGEELNYRRFFDVTTLTGVRVEDPAVFEATHALVLEQVTSGALDGLRIDHPDGLADPGGYLSQLAEATGGAWVVVEKILEPGEALPAQWHTAGTTGYDVLNDVLGLLVDPAGEAPLTALWQSLTGSSLRYAEVVQQTKHQVLRDVLSAEVNRLTEVGLAACRADAQLRDTTRRGLREALVEVLAAFDVYRAYLPPEGPADATARAHVDAAASEALAVAPGRAAEIEVVRRLALAEGPSTPAAREFVTRFQQTCGPVMAKGVEDTAFYRYLRLSALNEVGGDPGRFGLGVQDFHAANGARARDWPRTMTTLSTHDTKRSEDVRARLVLLAQCPAEWGESVTSWAALAAPYRSPAGPDAATEQLVWQSLVGAWPVSADRAVAYVEKATREAKAQTSWVDPVPAFDEAVTAFVRGVLADEQLVGAVGAFVDDLAPAWERTVLAQKGLQLTLPGVADTYQGSELFDLSLVDPDNRRPVDFALRRELLASMSAVDGAPGSGAAAPGGAVVDAGSDGAGSARASAAGARAVLEPPDGGRAAGDRTDGAGSDDVGGHDPGTAKLHLTAALLRLRRSRPDAFVGGSYEPLPAGERAVAYVRGGEVTVVAGTRALVVEREGWGEDAVELPAGRWTDVLSGGAFEGRVALATLLSDRGVAVLERT